MGALDGKFERSSTARTWEPAPIAKRSSVALGESEIIRCGIAAYAVLVTTNVADSESATTVATLKNFIKNSLNILREEVGQMMIHKPDLPPRSDTSTIR